MQRKLNRRVEFVQRGSYRETMDLLRLGKLDFAWICDYPYVYLQSQVRLLAVPLYQGRPYYRAYLIVPAANLHTTSVLQLRDMVFAYADPYSNTGYLAPRYELKRGREDPARFFRKTFFTWSHRGVVEAVASGLAHGGSVDSYIWDSLAIVEPELAAQTRIVSRSPEYGFPPVVAHRTTRQEDFAAMQQLLLGMAADPEGARILKRLNLDGFIPGEPALYNGVAHMMRAFGE
ncbi:MAG: PhnD/SsuA/transferrin family substrate-binding protein [Pseudomonadota bacterium]